MITYVRCRFDHLLSNRMLQTSHGALPTANRGQKLSSLIQSIARTTAMKVSSSAALATLTVTPADANDPAIQLVMSLASKLQVVIKNEANKKGSLSLELPSGQTLSQRNAILRCLGGMGLHNALDDQLMGGHSKASKASPHHAMALASLASWMSVADHYRGSKDFTELMDQLEKHLETRAFLVPSAVPTLADVDVASVIATEDASNYPNVQRWMSAVGTVLRSVGINVIPASVSASSPPTFFFGTEEGVMMPTKPQKKAPKKPVADASTDGPPKVEQQAPKEGKGKKAGAGGGKPHVQQAAATIDISALDIRVGKILKAWPHPDAEKLYCEEIDVGEEQPRQIASGLRPFYASADDLVGKTVMVLCNLKARNLVGFPSHGMVMCASNDDHTAVETMEPPVGAKIGERIMFEGFDGEPEAEAKVGKKKIFEAVAPDLQTNAEGVCVWKGAISKTSGGPVKASKGMANAHVA